MVGSDYIPQSSKCDAEINSTFVNTVHDCAFVCIIFCCCRPYAPGIYNQAHVIGWRLATDAVHAAGGLMFCQLWHVGRVAHPLHQSGQPPIAPSAIAAVGGKFRLIAGRPGYAKPKAIQDPKEVVAQFKRAAELAKEAGFDGVELHSANGYLSHQFLDTGSNHRQDEYGGDYKKRSKFTLECIDAIVSVWGPRRVGIKLSPGGGYNVSIACPFPFLFG
jgi:2,4-dienoyl-CoA reductase-like NADH-dependent reductase (Old Yellow Enzyme family)